MKALAMANEQAKVEEMEQRMVFVEKMEILFEKDFKNSQTLKLNSPMPLQF